MKAEDMRAVNRKNIICATIKCFEEYGIQDTTTRMIEDKSGVSLRTVTRCFPSKDELIVEATITYLADDLEERKRYQSASEYMQLTGLQQIQFILQKRGELMYSNPRYYLMMNEIELLIAEHHLDKRVSSTYMNTLKWVDDEVELALDKGIADGTIREDIDYRQASDLLTGIYKGLLQRLTIQCFYPEAGTFHPKEEINNFAEIAEDYLTHRK